MKISGIYKITNTVNGNFYIGSSKDVKKRWASHKCQSTWKKCSNNPMYKDMKKYGTDKFVFEILAEVEIDKLKEVEQEFIETLKPTYNNYNAKGQDIERYKEYSKERYQKYKEEILEQVKQYYESNKEEIKQYYEQYYESNKEEIKQHNKQYYESNKEEIKQQKKQYYESNKEEIKQQKKQYYESNKEEIKEYNNQLCLFNGETLTLCALAQRFRKAGIDHPTLEAKKYLLKQ